jgi:hypothetical protein
MYRFSWLHPVTTAATAAQTRRGGVARPRTRADAGRAMRSRWSLTVRSPWARGSPTAPERMSATHCMFISPVLRPSSASPEHVTEDTDFLEASWPQVTTCGHFRASQYLAQLRQK